MVTSMVIYGGGGSMEAGAIVMRGVGSRAPLIASTVMLVSRLLRVAVGWSLANGVMSALMGLTPVGMMPALARLKEATMATTEERKCILMVVDGVVNDVEVRLGGVEELRSCEAEEASGAKRARDLGTGW